MATYQALKVTSGTEQMPGVGYGQSAKVMASTYTFGAAPAAGDIVNSALIQMGSVITGVRVLNSTGAAVTAGVVGTPAYHISSSATPVQALNVANVPYVMPSNGYIIVTFAAGGGAGQFTVIVEFTPLNA